MNKEEAMEGIREAWTYKSRLKHLAMKLISFKAVIWYVATFLLLADRISADLWVILSTGMAGLNTYGKYEHRKHLRRLDNGRD